MKIELFLKSATANLVGCAADELRALSQWCNTKANEIEFEASRAAMIERDARWEREREDEEARENALVAKLKDVIEPGMRLKMKGCKDGKGLREFIRWDGHNLVCWQICQRVSFVAGDFRNPRREEWNSNTVTTHMPDKVQEIYIDGKPVKVRSLPN